MHFPKYWSRVTLEDQSVWGWSDSSVEDARALGKEKASRLAGMFRTGMFDGSAKKYPYGRAPLREPALRRIEDAQNGVAAIVSRNAYGCEVLNTSRMMFVDIDDQPSPGAKSGRSWLARLGLIKHAPANEEGAIMEKIRAWCGADIRRSARVYRTSAGYRLILPYQPFDPEASESERIMAELGADPNFRKLCHLQKSFRARLTPKPWRCGIGKPPAAWPFESPREESKFEAWHLKYKGKCSRYATARYLETLGKGAVASGFQTLIDLHDSETRAMEKGLELA